MSAPRLELRNLSAGYNGSPVVRNLDLVVEPGEVVLLLGPNGAGKTTTLTTISGLQRPIDGDVLLDGTSIAAERPHRVTRAGVAHVPEGRALFRALTVRENLRLGARGDYLDAPLRYFPALGKLLSRKAGLLSGGEQQMLAVGRVLAMRPRLLMVDEISLGLAPIIVEQLLPVIRSVADELRCGVLLVEQHVHLALDIADRAYVLAHGDVVLEGDAAEMIRNPDLLASSYLGETAIGMTAR